jgi:hypothetical protein
MKSLERRFQIEQDKNPNLSSLVNFGRAVEYQNFNEVSITRWFNKLVEKDDYDGADKKLIIEHMVGLSNKRKHPEECQKST